MRLRVLGLVALVAATAGCGALVGGDAGAPTVTPAPVPAVQSGPDDPRSGVVPGVSRSGVTDPGYLAERHAAIVSRTSYAVTIRFDATRRLDGTVADAGRVQRIVVENETVYRRDTSAMERRIAGDRRYLFGYAEYADGRAKYVSWLGDNDSDRVFRRYSDPSTRPQYAGIAASRVREYLALDSATVSRYAVEGSDADHYLVTGSRTRLGSVSTLENYTARAVIREDGFVRSLNVSYDAVNRGFDVSANVSLHYSDVGTATVSPPPWAAQAYAEHGVERTVSGSSAGVVTDADDADDAR